MAITLVEESRPARMWKYGGDSFELVAGKHLKIETSPGGEELLDAVVPAGKTWDINLTVNIVET